MKLTLWDEDTEILGDLDVKKHYYHMAVQEATTNVYLQEYCINTSKATIFKVHLFHYNVKNLHLINTRVDITGGKRLHRIQSCSRMETKQKKTAKSKKEGHQNKLQRH